MLGGKKMNCNICPRKCNVNREDKLGFCKMSNTLKIARASLHMWEEPCISGENGSGTVFFTGCTLKCVFCQNRDIATYNNGKEITIERLSDIFIELMDKGANNINLVTPTHYVPQIIKAINLAKSKGMNLPILYNTSGYESVDTLKMLDGIVDIYLPDFKYYSDDIAKKYSNVGNYVETAKLALQEMTRQIGKAKFDNGIMTRGVIVRHLILPSYSEDSKKVIKYLYETYGDDIYISIMNQYTPFRMEDYMELNRKVTTYEYTKVVDYAIKLGVTNGFVQEGSAASESFIPDFESYEGV